MKKVILPAIVLIILVISGCAEKPPAMPDGESRIIIKAFWKKSLDADGTPQYAPMSNAKVILTSEYGSMVKSTDASGTLDLSGIPSARYSISVRAPHPDDKTINLVGTKLGIEIYTGETKTDTIMAEPISSSGLSINEVYSAGPVNNQFYFYDQFIELYNSSDEIKYLDGMIVARFASNSISSGHKGPGADEDSDNDIDGVTNIFRFPGKPGEKNYAIAPKKFLVLAIKAIDHRKFAGGSIDLSKADWEFYNQFSADDIDNPNVPNLYNLRQDVTYDFLLGLTGDIIIITDGKDTNWQDGIDISTVIDGMEFKLSASSTKTLDKRVDRGSIVGPSRYSGKSLQRREPGFDSNDTGLDWEILPHPTPGFQK